MRQDRSDTTPAHILCDDPEAASRCIEVRWQATTADELSCEERGLWAALGGGGRLWHASAPSRWSRICVVRHAPRSQLDALQEHYRGVPVGLPVACLAVEGDGFHGQRQRSWSTIAGNLHLSIATPFQVPVARAGVGPSMVAATAVVDAVRRVGPFDPRIKWVNDVLLGEDKIAGVLTATQTQGQEYTVLFAGIGLNVERTPSAPPTRYVPGTSSLRAQAPHLSLGQVTGEVLDAMARRIEQLATEGVAPIHQAYVDGSMVVGRKVRIYPDHDSAESEPIATGHVRDIGVDLSLGLEGSRERITRGRLALDEACVRLEDGEQDP